MFMQVQTYTCLYIRTHSQLKLSLHYTLSEFVQYSNCESISSAAIGSALLLAVLLRECLPFFEGAEEVEVGRDTTTGGGTYSSSLRELLKILVRVFFTGFTFNFFSSISMSTSGSSNGQSSSSASSSLSASFATYCSFSCIWLCSCFKFPVFKTSPSSSSSCSFRAMMSPLRRDLYTPRKFYPTMQDVHPLNVLKI
ncbi:hypothetical protein FF38_07509 [Lucilia cuprina]|uniref:Uncharacterized protein n=1 Tax=Lucilia cuprina TaxID=7375 RepID=A0A0L0CLP1_LUCCU|nr:hypothetical protein FF38_07509 [Lucilia cuprina]